MVEHSEFQQASGLADKDGTGGKTTYLAALFTSALALILILLLWIYTPAYVVLLQNNDSAAISTVTAELQQNNIAYRYESDSGEILVPEKSLYHAKFVLGSKGIESESVPRLLLDSSGSSGQNSVHTNRLSENFVLESELAKTIASIDNIQWARVHLAIDEQGANSSKNNSRASVFVRLMPGRGLGESQIASIAHLVASSAANLSVENVNLIDQAGNLLKSSGGVIPSGTSSTRFSYVRILEQSYINKLEEALAPIFGKKAIRVRVDADVKFISPENGGASETGKRTSHTINKLTTTVVVDNKHVKSDDGQWVSIPRRKAELERVEKLVKDTIDFDGQRGDRVHVFNESFGMISKLQSQKGGFIIRDDKSYYIKVLLIAVFVVAICYVLLRYFIQKIMEMKPLTLVPDAMSNDSVAGVTSFDKQERSGSEDGGEIDKTNLAGTYEALLSKTRQRVNDNPANVVNVIKSWVRDNGR